MNTTSEFDYPPIVYKYRSWTNPYHLRILHNNEVFLSPPNDFNDPFDCRISKNFGLLDTEQKIDVYVQSMIDRHLDEIERRGLTPEGEFERMKSRVKDLNTYQRESDELTFQLQNDRFGVLSLSEIWDNILMWSHYGDFHKGICVGFYEEKLRASNLFGKGGPVVYDDNYPMIYPDYSHTISEEDLLQQYYMQTHYKAKDWEYEREYRLMTTFFGKADYGERTVVIPDECFAEIVLGVEFPKDKEAELTQIAKAKNIPLYRAVKVPFKFAIDRIKLA